MLSMNEKKNQCEAACERAVKARHWADAAQAASDAADCAEILAARTTGVVAAAYGKEVASWRALAAKLLARAKNAVPGDARRDAAQTAAADDEWRLAEKPDVTFDDVAGMADAKRAIEEMVILPLKSPEKARALGLVPGGGVLLFGPPGTGKTMLGKAIAGALDAPFYYASGADLRSKWYGESERRLSQLLNAAKSQPAAVVFLDEVESLLPKRTEESHAADNRVVTQFLADLGGFKDAKNLLLVLGATNKPWAIDEAVFRTGRFDEKIYVGPPDFDARVTIVRKNLAQAATADDVDVEALARKMELFSGSDCAAVVSAAKRSALAAAVRDATDPVVSAADFDAALARIPASVTPEILAPYEKFLKERF